MRVIKPEALREAALTGMPITKLSKLLNANRATVRKWIEADGLSADWTRARYKKAAVAA